MSDGQALERSRSPQRWGWWPWGLEGRLRRAQTAAGAGRLEKARALYARAWSRLERRLARGRAIGWQHQVALEGLARVDAELDHSDRALEHCRRAKALGLDSATFVELPGALLGRRTKIDEAGAIDLVDFVTWPRREHSAIPIEPIAHLLAKTLRPGGPLQAPEPSLDRLVQARVSWAWVYLYRAEVARTRRDFGTAARCLDRAYEVTTEVSRRARLAWLRAHTWALAGEPAQQAAAVQAALALRGPERTLEWILLAQAALHRRDPAWARTAVERAAAGAPASQAVLGAAERVAEMLGRWDWIVPVARRALAACRAGAEATVGAAVRLALRSAVETRDTALAVEASQRVAAGGATDHGLLLLASLFRIFAGAQPLREPKPTAEGAVLGLLALGCSGAVIEPRQLLSADAVGRLSAPWRRTSTLLAIASRFDARDFQALGALARSPHLQPGDATQHLRAATWAAVQRPAPDGVVLLAHLLGDPEVGRNASRALLAQAAGRWTALPAAKDPHAALRDTVALVTAALALTGSAHGSDRPLPGPVARWCCAVTQLGERRGLPVAHRGPAVPLPSGFDACLGALASATRWEEAATAELRARPAGPAATWLRPQLARRAAERRDFTEAAALLGATGVGGVLAALGAQVPSVSWHEAWHALRAGDAVTALRAGVEAIAAHDAPPPAGLVALVVAAVDAGAGADLDDDRARESLRALARQSLAWSLDATGVERWPWRRLGRAGVPALASASLARQLAGSAEGLADRLHAVALLAEAACRDAAAAGETASGQRFLLLAVACWSALSRQDEALHRFAAARLRVYEVADAPPVPTRLASLIDEHVEALIRELGDRTGLGFDRGSLLAHLERCALDAVRGTDGLAEQLRAGRPAATVAAAGPLLVALLGLQGELNPVLDTGSRPMPEDLAWFLALLRASKDDGAAELAELLRGPGGNHQVRRLYSSLGPATTLLGLHKFDQVAAQIGALVDSGTREPGPAPDLAATLLATLWPDREALREDARNLLVETWLGVIRTAVAQCPIELDGLRDRMSEALIACGRVDRTAQISEGIAEIAVGRASALLQRPADSDRKTGVDRRSSEARRAEALELLRLTWKLTRHTTVQGPLTSALNSEAVRAGNQDDCERALALLIEAMEVNPSARQAADNLVIVVGNRCLTLFDPSPDLAEAWTVRARASLEELLERHPGKAGSEIRRCLDTIGDKLSTPFYNASGEARGRRDWKAAAAFMLQATRVGPDDAATRQGLQMLALEMLVQGPATVHLAAPLMARVRSLVDGDAAGFARAMKTLEQVQQS